MWYETNVKTKIQSSIYINLLWHKNYTTTVQIKLDSKIK